MQLEEQVARLNRIVQRMEGEILELKAGKEKSTREYLFTSLDGIQIYAGDPIFPLLDGEIWEGRAGKDDSQAIRLSAYSTREAAEQAYEKWLADQPVLSLNDIGFYDLGETNWNNLLETVKDKLAKR